MRNTRLPIIALGALILSGQAAYGQSPIPLRYNEGPGIRLGENLIFHPGVALEMRYDTNVLATDRQRQDAPYLRLLAHIDLATSSPQRQEDPMSGRLARQKLFFRLGAAAGYREYLSEEDVIVEQRAVEVDGNLELRYEPSPHFALVLSDNFSRTVTPLNTVVAAGSATSQTISRDVNAARAGVSIVPGGGRLTMDLGYALNLDAYEEDGFSINNRLYHGLDFTTKYRVLPKTALFVQVMQQFYDYYNAEGVSRFVSSSPLRAYAGLSGLLTTRLSMLLKAGYGNGFYDSGESFNNIIAEAEAGYRIGPTAQMRLGYGRSFEDSVFGNFFTDHRVFAGYDHLIARRVMLHLLADFRLRNYEDTDIFPGITAQTVESSLFNVGFGVDWRVQDWVYVGVGYDLQLQEITNGPESVPQIAGLIDYVRHQLYGKVGVSY